MVGSLAFIELGSGRAMLAASLDVRKIAYFLATVREKRSVVLMMRA
jgi:hypothetical protein